MTWAAGRIFKAPRRPRMPPAVSQKTRLRFRKLQRFPWKGIKGLEVMAIGRKPGFCPVARTKAKAASVSLKREAKAESENGY
jgi:hypothetical protein